MDRQETINYSDSVFALRCMDEKVNAAYSDDDMLVYVKNGLLRIRAAEKYFTLKSGEFMFLRHGHNLLLSQQPQGDGLPYEAYGIAFNRKPMFNIYRLTYAQEPLEKADYDGDVVTGIPATPELISLFTGIKAFLSYGQEPDDRWITLKVYEASICLWRYDEQLYSQLFNFGDPWKMDLLDYMNRHFQQNMKLSEIARQTGRTLSTFKREFRKLSDMTPQRWIIQKRLTVAHQMLSNEKQSIRDVASKVGFSNISYFSRIFKEYYGYPPTHTYRIVRRGAEPAMRIRAIQEI